MLSLIVARTPGIAKLKNGLMRELDTRLAIAGFHRLSERFYGNLYSRESSDVRHGIHISSRPYTPELEVAVESVSLRFHQVEALVAKIEDPHPLIDARAIAIRSTLAVGIAESVGVVRNLLRGWGGSARKVWLVRSLEDLSGTASEMAALALEKGEPIFATLSDPECALQILSRDDEEARSYSCLDEVRAVKAVAFAFLLHGESAAKKLGEIKLARLRGDAASALHRSMGRLFHELN